MTNENKRPVSTLLGIGIFLVPGIFSWFTLQKGYSTLAKIVSFSWLVIALYGAYPMMKKKAQEIPMLFGSFPEHIKAQQCLTVSRFLPENEVSVWREASSKRINYWLEHESGCSNNIDCMEKRQALSSFVEQKSAPDGNRVSKDILKEWMNSEYCQTLVASYKNILNSKTTSNQNLIKDDKENQVQENNKPNDTSEVKSIETQVTQDISSVPTQKAIEKDSINSNNNFKIKISPGFIVVAPETSKKLLTTMLEQAEIESKIFEIKDKNMLPRETKPNKVKPLVFK